MDSEASTRGLDAAWATAVAAAHRAGVRLVEVIDPTQADGRIFRAFHGEEPNGMSVASLEPGSDGEASLRSHVDAAIDDPESEVAMALRWRQRAWCLERGIARVRWTFDPLVRSDAVVSLVELGARAVGYREDTDGLEVDWELTAPRTEAAAAGRAAAPDVAALRRAGAQPALTADPSGAPVMTPTVAARRLVQVPEAIEAIRATDQDLARSWTTAIRAALGEPLGAGFRISGMTRDGWYVLAADRQVAELADRR